MKRFILKEEQLNKYIERKKSQKIFNSILEEMYRNSKHLNESVSINKANQMVIEDFKRRNLLLPDVVKLLKENKLLK